MAQADAGDSGAAQPGLKLGAWVLWRHLGRGGLGEVWEAERDDGLYQANAAVKLLHGDSATPAIARRFLRERTALGRLTHGGIAALLDAGLQPPHAYLVLELVDGRPLNEYARTHSLDVAHRVALWLQVAEAVEYAHTRLVVHRDLKPANVMVTAAGVPKLLDFGLAASPGEPAHEANAGLTPGYAAPEVITTQDAAAAVDVFSLGVMLFELLTGSLPFGQRGDSRTAMEYAVLHQPPHRMAALLAVPHDALNPAGPGRPRDARRALGDLEAIAAKALAKQPLERYVSAHAFIEDLRRWQQRLPVHARSHQPWRHRGALLWRRHAGVLSLGGLLLICLAAGTVLSAWQWREANRARQHSDDVTRFVTELLAAGASPRPGPTPTVLDLLDESRSRLQHFDGSTATRERLLAVMSATYLALNRFDHALPLARQWLSLAQQSHDEDAPALLRARLHLGRVQQVMGNHDEAVALLEPLTAATARHFGADSEELLQQQFTLAACYMHLRRLDDAERAMDRVRVLTEKLHAADAPVQADYLQNLSVLRQRQGRLAEALDAVRQTQRFWNDPDPRLTLLVLVLRHTEITTLNLNAMFDGVDERAAPLLADIRRQLGPGNDLQQQAAAGWADVMQLQGRHADEARLRQTLVDQALADGLPAAELLDFRAEALQAHARLGRPRLAALQAAVREATAMEAGSLRNRSLLLLADTALAAGLPDLADTALRPLRQPPVPAALAKPGSRLAKMEGRLARARGNLARSAELLATVRPTGRVQAWSARLDEALTAVLQGAPDAAARLAEAGALRPASLPAGHPLDHVSTWLQARLTAGRDDAPAVRAAWARLADARGPAAPAPTRGNLGGLLP